MIKIFTVTLDEYEGESGKLNGLKSMKLAGLNIPYPVLIFPHSAFLEFKENGIINLKKDIEHVHSEIIKTKKGVIVRRSWHIPNLINPPGPRTSSIETLGVLFKEVTSMYKFVLENGLDREGADIEIYFHPFIFPKIPLVGGCVTPHKNNILIETIYGHDEAVQSFAHDSFFVNEKGIIRKIINYKEKCLQQISDKKKYSIIDIPQELRIAQTLADEEIIKISENYTKIMKSFGPCRLEFNFHSKNDLFFIECLPFKHEKENGELKEVIKISDLNDLKKIEKNKIIFIDPYIIRERKMGILTQIAFQLPQKTNILYPGSKSTAHSSIIFKECGHELIYVAHEDFSNNDKIILKEINGEMEVKKVNGVSYSKNKS